MARTADLVALAAIDSVQIQPLRAYDHDDQESGYLRSLQSLTYFLAARNCKVIEYLHSRP